MTILNSLNFDFSTFVHLVNAEIVQKGISELLKLVKKAVFEIFDWQKVDFTENLRVRKIAHIPHCVLS